MKIDQKNSRESFLICLLFLNIRFEILLIIYFITFFVAFEDFSQQKTSQNNRQLEKR